MSFEAMAWAVKQKLPVKQKIVLLMLADRINKDTGRCHPSIRLLAEDCGMSDTSVKEALRSLREGGFIEAHERFAEGQRLPNEYGVIWSNSQGVGRNTPQGGAPHAPGVGRNTPSEPIRDNQEDNQDSPADLFPKEEGAERQVEPSRFDEFWNAYPPCIRKTDKPKARALFDAIVAGKRKGIPKTPAQVIIDGLRAYARSSPDPQFIPLPTTWLNGARWEVGGGGGGEHVNDFWRERVER